MKNLLLLIPALFFAMTLTAQESVPKEEVEAATREMTELYQLDVDQAVTMYEIQERRLRNLNEIAPLEKSDYRKFLYKKRSIRIGTEGSIKRMLNKEQLKIFQQQKVERRKKEAALIKELRLNGATKEEIQMAILESEE